MRLLYAFDEFFQPFYRLVLFVFSGVKAFFKGLLGLLSAMVMIPYEMVWTSRLGEFLRNSSGYHDPLEKIKHEANRLVEKHSDKLDPASVLLIKGAREDYAKTIINPKAYPWAYKNAPEDLVKSIVVDGRVAGGADLAPNVAPQVISENFVRKSWIVSIDEAAKLVYKFSAHAILAVGVMLSIFLFVFAVLLEGSLVHMDTALQRAPANFEAFSKDISKGLRAEGPLKLSTSEKQEESKSRQPLKIELALDATSRANALQRAIQVADVFDQDDLVRVAEEQEKGDLKIKYAENQSNTLKDGQRVESARRSASIIASVAFSILLLVGVGLLLAYVGFRFFQLSIFRGLVYGAAVRGVAEVQLAAWREAIQRYNKRAEINAKELRQYNAQVEEVMERDKSPVYTYGKSLGILKFRGHSGGIPAGQKVATSFMDANRHTLVFGSTGTGKTRKIVLPRVKWLLEQLAKGLPVSMFVLDNKGALVRSVARLLSRTGLDKSLLRVIGTGENELRMNPCEALTPAELGDLLVSFMSQASGGADESAFWTERGKNLVINVAVLARAFECLEAGRQWGDKTGFRPYSFLGLFVLMSDDAQLDYALECVAQALQTEDRARIAHLEGISMSTSLTWLATSWKALPDVTKGGVQTNAERMLVSFIHYDELAQGFATGRGDNLVSPSELMRAGITGLNISQIKYDSAGRLINIALKTMWLKFARESQINDPDFAEEREHWWRHQDRELTDQEMDAYSMRYFIADEYQALMTAGGQLSDTDVWNEIRSAGVCGIVITQSLSSIKYALGAEGTKKFMQNFNNLVVLSSTDEETVDFVVKLAGKVQRFSVIQENQYESVEALKLLKGIDPERLPAAQLDSSDIFSPGQFSSIGMLPFNIPAYKAPYEVDRAHLELLYKHTDAGWREQLAASYREEDKNIAILQSGETTEDAVSGQDIERLGMGNALVYLQRGGMPRMDFVTLEG